MDTFEIITAIRNITRLHAEEDIATQELMRNINLGYFNIANFLYPFFAEDLVIQKVATSQSGNYDVPQDVMLLVNVYRKNTGGTYKICRKIEVDDKDAIGTIAYPSDEDFPMYVQMGTSLEFTPALSSTDIKLEYRRNLVSLQFGIGNVPVTKDYITLSPTYKMAPIIDDVLNGHFISLYKLASEVLTFEHMQRITDYDGANRRAYLTAPEAVNYYYATVPFFPKEFHIHIIDAALMYLSLAGYYPKDSEVLEKKIENRLIQILQLNGFEYNPKKEGRK